MNFASYTNIVSKLNSVKLVAVSKNQSVEHIMQLYNCGVRNFGESYISEAIKKIEILPKDICWHYIGRIQSRQAALIARHFKICHSLDRIKIALKLNSLAPDRLQVYIQVNVDNSPTKAGIKPENLRQFAQELKTLDNLEVVGLMCLPDSSAGFNTLRDLLPILMQIHPSANELSMGTSGDWPEAIKSGSTCVRIGRTIFGAMNE